LDIIRRLAARGMTLRVYDPQGMPKARAILKGLPVVFAKSALDCLEGAHAGVLVTEWEEFRKLDFVKAKKIMALPILVDGRNFWEPEVLRRLGFRYRGIGRS
jgi:UDPglucose 6-dehydrogenase